MAKHIKNYSKAKAIMKDYFARCYKRAEDDLRLAEETYGNKDRLDKELGCYRFPNGSICTEQDVEYRRRHLMGYLPKSQKEYEAMLEAADKAGRLIEIDIRVEWVRNRTWGYNPHATAWLMFEDEEYGSFSARGDGRASGCGYDKRSAAVEEALCFATKKGQIRPENAKARASLGRFVIEHGEALWKEYAVDRTPFPHLCFGGKGMSTFSRLFRKIGCKPYGECAVNDYLIDYCEPDGGTDVYHIIRKDRI